MGVILTKVKYTGKEDIRIRLLRTGGKEQVKNDEIVEVEKDNLEYFTKNGFIEVKIADEKKETKKVEKKVSPKKK